MRRFPFACAIGVAAILWGAGCGSDRDESDSTTPTNNSTTTSNAGTSATVAVTTTTAVSTITAAPVTTSAATATTAGGRVVTSPSDNVKLGDTGPGVEQIQAALKAADYDIGVDGVFGPVTDRAVRDFQKENGLTVDGVVGPQTWAKLSAAGSGGAATTTSG